jgi:hypothetical protein
VLFFTSVGILATGLTLAPALQRELAAVLAKAVRELS